MLVEASQAAGMRVVNDSSRQIAADLFGATNDGLSL